MVYNKCIHHRRRRRQRNILTFPFLILVIAKSLYCGTHAAEQDDVFINTFKATYKILTLKTSFITSKKLLSYTKDDWAMLDEAFQFFMVDVQATYQHKQHGHNQRNLRSVTRRIKMNTNAMLHPSSAFVSVLRSCPVHYSPTMFYTCREAAAQYDVMLSIAESDADGIEKKKGMIEMYTNATRAAIDDGLLQKSLNTLHPESGISIIGSSHTVASHFASVDDRNTILTIQNSLCIVRTQGAINESELIILEDALQALIILIVSTLEGNKFWHTKLGEGSFEVDSLETCQSSAHNSTYSFCKTVVFHYNLIVSGTKQHLNDIYDGYSTATNKAIYDGTLQQILQKKDDSKSLMVLETPSRSSPKMQISSSPRAKSPEVPLVDISTEEVKETNDRHRIGKHWIAAAIGVAMVLFLWNVAFLLWSMFKCMFKCSLNRYKKEKLKNLTDEDFDKIVREATIVLSDDGWD